MDLQRATFVMDTMLRRGSVGTTTLPEVEPNSRRLEATPETLDPGPQQFLVQVSWSATGEDPVPWGPFDTQGRPVYRAQVVGEGKRVRVDGALALYLGYDPAEMTVDLLNG